VNFTELPERLPQFVQAESDGDFYSADFSGFKVVCQPKISFLAINKSLDLFLQLPLQRKVLKVGNYPKIQTNTT